MLDFFYFLVSNSSGNEVFGSWYSESGNTLGIITVLVIALIFVLVFYYGLAKVKALTTIHWFITMVVNAVVSFFACFLEAKSFLADYVTKNALDQIDPTAIGRIAKGTIDMWLYATNSLVWSLVFFFVLSVILKRWSSSYNIPFGVSRKNNRRK